MITTPALTVPALNPGRCIPRQRPQPIPDLSREALQIQLRIPSPRAAALAELLAPLPAPPEDDNARPPLPGRPPRSLWKLRYDSRRHERYRRRQPRLKGEFHYSSPQVGMPAELLAEPVNPEDPTRQALVATAWEMAALARTAQAEFQSRTKPGLPERTNGGEWRLLPLSGYEEFRTGMDRRLAAHAILRERWIQDLRQWLQSLSPNTNRELPPEDELRQRWQARLEMQAAPTLSEYAGITKDDRLTGQRRKDYRQAAMACRNANRLKECQGVRSQTGCSPWE